MPWTGQTAPDGRVWMSTDGGLYAFSPEKGWGFIREGTVIWGETPDDATEAQNTLPPSNPGALDITPGTVQTSENTTYRRPLISIGDDGAGAVPTTQEALLKDQWNFYKEVFLPLEKEMLKASTLRPDVAHQKQAASQAFSNQARIQDASTARGLASYGVDWNDPKFAGAKREISLAQGAAEVDTRNKLQQASRDLPIQRMSQLAMLGQGIPAQTEASLSSAATINAALESQKQGLYGSYGSAIGSLAGGAAGYYAGQKSPGLNSAGTTPDYWNPNAINYQSRPYSSADVRAVKW